MAGCLLAPSAAAHLAEQEKLMPSDGVADDRFGTAVDVEEPMAVVSSPFHDVAGTLGAVYVFQKNTNTDWPEVAKLTPTGAGPMDMFGEAVAIAGPYIAVGAPSTSSDTGAVYIFNGFGAVWTQTQVLTASDATPGHLFGRKLDMRGDTLVVGAPDNEATYVFRLVAGTWVEEQKITRPAGLVGDLFGTSVSLLGDELVVGAPGDDTDDVDAGSVYLFERTGTVWSEIHRFGSATPGPGDAFGEGAGIGSLYVVVGAPFDDDFGADSGAAHYFERDGSGGWISGGVLTAPAAPTAAGDHLGRDILTDTDLILISQPDGDLQGTQSGGAQTFVERAGSFFGDVMFPSDTFTGDHLGASIGMDRCWMISGAPLDDDQGENSGSAYLFLSANYTQFYCLPGISGKGCAATLSTIGTASASATSGFNVLTDGVEGGITGVYFYGTNGPQQNPWGNGTSFQCVVPPVIRMGTITSMGAPNECTGQFSMDLNATWCSTCPRPTKNPGPGTEIYLQMWYRDPTNTSNQSTSMSNAAQIGVCP